MNMNKEVVVLSVDPGSDDFTSILLCLHAEAVGQIILAAILCSFGNTSLENSCKNLAIILQAAGRTDIPVFRGASKSLLPLEYPAGSFHGSNGFGGLNNSLSDDNRPIFRIDFETYLAELALRNPGRVHFLSLGPLTNLALALQVNETLSDNLESVWIMGGNFDGDGNVERTVSEFNFYTDPEAAVVVLDSICNSKPIFILPWQTCKASQVTLDWRFNVFGPKGRNDPAIALLNELEERIYDSDSDSQWDSCDSFLLASFLNTSGIVAKISNHNVTVELNGRYTRGEMVADLDDMKSYKNVFIIEDLNWEAYKSLLMAL